MPLLPVRAPDIQAALNVIGRRPTHKGDPPLDLTQIDLRKANLGGVDLAKAQLDWANLTEAQLGWALASWETVWPDGWDRTRRAAAKVNEPDEEAPPAASQST